MIKLVRMKGNQKFRHGPGYRTEEVDTGIDQIMDGRYCIGYIKRDPGSAICLTQKVSPSTMADIKAAVDFRDKAASWGEIETKDRKVAIAPDMPPDEDENE